MTLDESMLNEISYLSLLAIEGKVSREQFDRLSDLLSSRPQARHYYAVLLDVHLGLEDLQVQSELHEDRQIGGFNPAVLQALAEYERIAPTTPVAIPSPKPAEKETIPSKPRQPVNKISLAMTLVATAAMFLLFATLHRLGPRPVGTVGRLNHTTGAKWATVNGAIEPGSDLCPGPIQLLEGAAEIILDGGTTLILEAPALLELETLSRIFLNRGRLVATVEAPDKERFVVRTPFSTVVDFGTEFGVQVDAAATQTRVYRGQVELRSGADPLKYHSAVTLNADQGGSVSANGVISRVEIMPQTFLRRGQYETMERAARGDRFARWKAFNDQLHRDPALAAHYTFEQTGENDKTLENTAPKTMALLNGTLEGEKGLPQWVAGRWPQKHALRFDRQMSQRVVVGAQETLSITGPITTIAWIYLEPGDQAGHLLSNRDRWNVNYQFGWLGESHPDKPRRNRIQLLRYSQERTQRGYSPVVSLSPGVWHCLAATHDNQTARFYLDGVLLSEEADPYTAEPTQAELVIGDVPFEGLIKWRFDGTVDEIVILRRVMTPGELRSMYLAGKP